MNFSGPLFVVVAAFLWATDALVRVPSLDTLNPFFLVFSEHVIIVLAMILSLPLWKAGTLAGKDIPAAIGVGVGGSALATLLFTQSFQTLNPSVAILIQKLQPVCVVVLAYVFLGERPAKSFYPWATLALAAAVAMNAQDLGEDRKLAGVLNALGAALLWAGSTIFGRRLLLRYTSSTVTFWRFFLGFVGILLWALVTGKAHGIVVSGAQALSHPTLLAAVFFIALGPGLAAMNLYYRGLARTPASVVTFLELVFPVSAVVLNALVLDARLTALQMISGGVLLFAVTQLSRAQ